MIHVPRDEARFQISYRRQGGIVSFRARTQRSIKELPPTASWLHNGASHQTHPHQQAPYRQQKAEMTRPLSETELSSIRETSASVLAGLQKETLATSNDAVSSWLTGKPLPSNATDRCRFFHQQGFLLVENFVGMNCMSACIG